MFSDSEVTARSSKNNSCVQLQIDFVTLFFFHSSPAATAVISLAFGRYILEPFFMQCEIPELAIKLVTAVGISKYPILGFREG